MLAKRIPIAYFLMLCIAAAAVLVVWLALTRGAAPANAVLIDEPGTPVPLAAKAPNATPTASDPAASASKLEPTAVLTTVAVYVTGAVEKPGVYTLPAGSRISDAVAAAGGLSAEADAEGINMAEHVSDAEHILVPTAGAKHTADATISAPTAAPASTKAPSPKASSTAQVTTPGQKLNINTATAAELETLPGIGTVLAGRIITEREAHGPYTSVDDLARVAGIKDSIISKIRDLVTVGP